MAAETGFLIDGTVYEVPGLMSLDMDERQLMYELSGYIQEDFLQESDETEEEYDERLIKMMRNPGVYRTLMTVAYQRGNPTMKPSRVTAVIARTNYMDAISTMLDEEETPPKEEEEEEAVPLASTTEPAVPSQSDSVTLNDSDEETSRTSGSVSTNGSAEPGDVPVSIGIGRSDTSSLRSIPTRSAV